MSRQSTHMYGRSPVSAPIRRGIRRKLAKLTSKKMALQMLGMQIRFRAVRTRELPICILGWYDSVFASTNCGNCWSAGSTRQDTSPTLRAYNMCRCFHVLQQHMILTIRRLHVTLHMLLHSLRRHRRQNLISSVLLRRRSDSLWVRHGHCSLRHHGARSPVSLALSLGLGRLLIVVGHHLLIALLRLSCHLRKVAHVVR